MFLERKKHPNALYVPKKLYLCTVKQKNDNRSLDFGLWCNGNTTDSGPVFLGSNPSSPTEKCPEYSGHFFCICVFHFPLFSL